MKKLKFKHTHTHFKIKNKIIKVNKKILLMFDYQNQEDESLYLVVI